MCSSAGSDVDDGPVDQHEILLGAGWSWQKSGATYSLGHVDNTLLKREDKST